MANAIYPKFKEALLKGLSNVDLTSGTIKVTLIDTADYTYSTAHDFYDDVPVAARVATGTLANPTVSAAGVFDADDLRLTGVSGDTCEALIIWKDTGSEATSRLVFYQDSVGSGLPITPNGGSVLLEWDSGANKIFAL